MAELVVAPYCALIDRRIRTHNFEWWSSQTNDLKIYTCCFVAWHTALGGYGMVWLALYRASGTVSQ